VPSKFGEPLPILVLQAISEGAADLGGVVAADRPHRPAGGLEARELVGRVGETDRAVDGDVVVVPQHRQAAELQPAGEADRLLADAFHQAAVAGHHPGAVVDQVAAESRREVTLGDGHADRGGQALAERAGGGLDAGGVAIFRVARRDRAELPERPDLIHCHGFEARQVEQGVE
jgi:hypothetical protein